MREASWYGILVETAGSQPFTWVAWVKISVFFTYRIYPFETFDFFCSCILCHCFAGDAAEVVRMMYEKYRPALDGHHPLHRLDGGYLVFFMWIVVPGPMNVVWWTLAFILWPLEVVYYAPRFFRNNSWTAADIEIKLGIGASPDIGSTSFD